MNWLLLLAVFGAVAAVQPLDDVLNHIQPTKQKLLVTFQKKIFIQKIREK